MGASCFGGGRVARGDASVFILLNPIVIYSSFFCLDHCSLIFHIGSMRLSSVHHAPPTRYQPQCGHGADCPARWLATISGHVGAEQASSCCGCSDARMAA